MNKDIHIFENGIKVYRHHFLPSQIERYEKIRNVHEADEEDLFIKVLRSSPRVDCFLSIGSAIGYYPLLAKKTLPTITIHAYEPLRIFREYFKENIRLNDFNLNSFIIHAECVSSSKKRAFFLEAKYGSKILDNKRKNQIIGVSIKTLIRNLLTKLKLKNYPISRITSVDTISLDELVYSIGKTIDFMQMDVQGHELEILKSGSDCLKNNSIKIIMMGTHGSDLHNNCIRFLMNCNYHIEIDEQSTKHQPDGIILASK